MVAPYDVLIRKAESFPGLSNRKKKKWYYKQYPIFKTRRRVRHMVNFLIRLKLPKYLSFMRWMLVDFLRAKKRRFWGIYQFVALPGEGKTISMVAHMERVRAERGNLIIATNFSYAREDYHLYHWLDIIEVATIARREKKSCIIALDEIHVTFDSSDWKTFPPEMLALLSFNRKFSLQFICSSQIYERIPKKIRDIANYTVICKNVLGADRYFINYYYSKDDYEARFEGNKKNAQFIKDFIADDNFYALYDTLEQIDQMKEKAAVEKTKREEAFNLLFGSKDQEQDGEE